MTNIKRAARRLLRGKRQDGSALLVSLMVMVGLSLLGLAFVAISETENAIALNERNHAQTVSVAEAGAKLVVQWFQDPTTNLNRGLMPANTNAIKANRTIGGYTGYYKPTAGTKICDLPFGPDYPDLFCGDENNPDVIINETTAPSFLASLNSTLFQSLDNGQITEIIIYAPPIIGGNKPAGYYTKDGQRFGIASVRVTAQKRPGTLGAVAQAIVRIVVGPFPLPGPTGALQAIGGVGSNGDFDVHWGTVESEVSTGLKKQYSAIPWFNAWDIAHIERGWDSSRQWAAGTSYQGNSTYPLGDTVRPTPAASAAAQAHEYTAIQVGAGTSGGTEPAWPTSPGATVVDGSVTWKERPPTMYPIKTADSLNYDNHAWLYEIPNKTVDDPWFQLRSWGQVQGNATSSPHPYPWTASTVTATWGYTHYFQYQTFSSRPDYKIVQVPRFNYDFWKAAALGGRGQPGVYYLTKNGANYTDGVATKSMSSWLSSGNGFYFFETVNNQNPQNGGPGILDTGGGDPCGFKGFVYANLDQIKSTGCGGSTGWYQQPGEPYRDIGYRQVVETTTGTQTRGDWDTDAAGNFVVAGAFNGRWDYQDLDWSNTNTSGGSTGTKNQIFDLFMAQRTVKPEDGGAAFTDWFPVEYFPGCKPGNNITCPTCNCSEPHEPYLNIRYNGVKTSITLGWSDPSTAGRPKVTDTGDPSGTPVTCAAADVSTAAGQANCTTNAYDYNGGLAQLAPGVNGVIYNEGQFTSTGNGVYYGSIVLGQSSDPKGTCEVYFDETLLKGGWPPKGVTFPRVMIVSEQIQ